LPRHPNGIDAASFTTIRLASGAAWDVDSIRGKGTGDATRVTAGNFLRAVPSSAVLDSIALVILAAPSRGD
jgi:hypothetical protein